MDQNWKCIAPKLPVEPCADLMQAVMNDIYDGESALGEGVLLYSREAVTVMEDIKQTMLPEDWAHREETAKRRWGARCTCSMCGDEFISGYHKGGILLAEGEDGVLYDGYVEEGEGAISYSDGETLFCPHCYFAVTLTRRSELRSGRTYQAMQAEVVNVDEYTAVMYWLVSRHITDIGCDSVSFYPHSSLVIDLEGKIRRFRAERIGGEIRDVVWTPCGASRDPMQIPYYSWEAVNRRKVGGWTLAYGPELGGHTGEKTALDLYIGAGGCWPGAYLHVWQKHPQIENLMRQGFAAAVCDSIDVELCNAGYWRELCDAPTLSWADWSEVKPHRMLHMSKQAFREIRMKRWTASDADCWARYRLQIPGADAYEFEYCRERIGSSEIGKLLEMLNAGWDDLTPLRTVRYLEKQNMVPDGVQHLIDYRKVLHDAGMAETEETLWPRNLLEAHERLTQYWAHHHDLQYQLGFSTTFIRYRDLEWTDGDLCVVLPKLEAELVAEGETLRHCVGTYGKSHCSGKPVFFIRHHRRPERSYYTLQIDMTGKIPKEIQLHGYGNERHGEHKQYKHGIPKKVREFCNRWEREIVTPWFARDFSGRNREKVGKTVVSKKHEARKTGAA